MPRAISTAQLVCLVMVCVPAALWHPQDSADPNVQDKQGRTVLHTAACTGNIQLVKLLLENKADITIEDKWGVTPLECAEQLGHPGLQEVFLEASSMPSEMDFDF